MSSLNMRVHHLLAALINASSLYINCTNLIEPDNLLRERGTDLDYGVRVLASTTPKRFNLHTEKHCMNANYVHKTTTMATAAPSMTKMKMNNM